MSLATRQERILDLLSSSGERSVEELAGAVSVSGMTIRRDLAALEKAGKLARTWGGARVGRFQALDFGFREKANRDAAEKRRIGVAAAGLVQPGQSVFLDTGTTAVQVAHALLEHERIRVLTCSLPVVAQLIGAPGLTLTMLGGTVRADSLEVYGPLTERGFASVRADIAFLGVDAVSETGELLTHSMETARVCELIMNRSRRRILVADHSKWGADAPVTYGTLDALDAVVTGKELPVKVRNRIRKAGVELIMA